jgi:hypothetical protein
VSCSKTVGCAPSQLEFVNQRILQLVERRENDIGEVLAQMPENLLGWVQFGTVGWQVERMHACWPTDLPTAMTARTVQHDPKRTLAQLVAQMVQEDLQAVTFHARQQQKDAGAGGGFHRRIQPQPLVLILHDKGADVLPPDTSASSARSSGQNGPHRKPRCA